MYFANTKTGANIMIFSKWDTLCSSTGPKPRIVLRKKVFYFMIELPADNGKRRFYRKSLKTTDYYEARHLVQQWIIKDMTMRKKPDFDINSFGEIVLDSKKKAVQLTKQSNIWETITNLFNKISFVDHTGMICCLSQLDINRPFTIHEQNDYVDVSLLAELTPEALKAFKKLAQDNKAKDEEIERYKKIIDKLIAVSDMVEGYVNRSTNPYPDAKIPEIKIKDILNLLQIRAGADTEETKRKIKRNQEFVELVNLTTDDLYEKFHTLDTIQKITEHIALLDTINSSGKGKRIRYLREFVQCAVDAYPKYFDTSIISFLPKFKKTPKGESKPYFPFSQDQLKNILNPEHNFFTHNERNMDLLFGVLISLFTGSRITAAFTLETTDIQKDKATGIWYFDFNENHPYKRIKNEDTIRRVPIHKTLLEMNIVDIITERKQLSQKKHLDFIFSVTTNKKNDNFNEHIRRNLHKFLQRIGIRESTKSQYAFHGFRKSCNIQMIKSHIEQSYIDKLIGWDSPRTADKYYSDFSLQDLKIEMDKLDYSFLRDEFNAWKSIFSKRYL